MSDRDLLLKGWDWEPSVVVGCAALAIAYLIMTRARPARKTICFLSGVLLLLLDLCSPLDLLGDRYLFSAHIAQHSVLALVVPPLLILGMPRLPLPEIPPAFSWVLGVGTMIFWHVPVFFNAALGNEGLHIAQHLSFLATGVIFWLPVIDRRMNPLMAISYLFSACLACSVLGASLTFARPGLYPAYTAPEDPLGLLPLIRGEWGIGPADDQQLGGLLMWVPGCFLYLSAILATVAQWYGMKEETA